MADAKKAALEVAWSMQPTEEERCLKEQDNKYQRVAPLAIKRIQHLLEDKTHFLNQAREQGKDNRKKAREHKQALYNALTKSQTPNGHRWDSKGCNVQCRNCTQRLTMHNKAQELQDGAHEECSFPTVMHIKGGGQETIEGDNKAGLLKNMVTWGNMPSGSTPTMWSVAGATVDSSSTPPRSCKSWL